MKQLTRYPVILTFLLGIVWMFPTAVFSLPGLQSAMGIGLFGYQHSLHAIQSIESGKSTANMIYSDWTEESSLWFAAQNQPFDPKEKKKVTDSQKEAFQKYYELTFRYSVAKTNLWFYPVGAIGSAGLGYLLIQIPPDNWYKTIVYVYGWAGIGSAAVALGLSFYTVYEFFSLRSQLREMRAQYHFSDQIGWQWQAPMEMDLVRHPETRFIWRLGGISFS